MTKGRGVIAYFFAMFLFFGSYLAMIQRIVSEIAFKYSMDNTAMGLIIVTTFVGYFISPILTGEAADRLGRKPVMLIGFIAMLVGSVITLTINNPIAVGAGLLINGMAFGTLELTMSSILTDIKPGEANRIMNNSRLFFAFGTISGPFIAMGLIELTKDWVYVMAFAIVCLSIFFVVFLLLSYPKEKYPNLVVKKEESRSLTFKLLKNSTLLILCISIMMYVAVEVGLTFYVSKYIGQISTNQFFSTLTLSVFWLFVAIGRFGSAKIEKKLHSLIGLLAVLACIGLAISFFVDGLVLSIIAFGIMGLGCSGMFPTLLALGKIYFPKYAGTVFGILISSGAIGGIIQPYIMGAVADATNLKIALATCIVPLVIIIVMQVVLRAAEKDTKII